MAVKKTKQQEEFTVDIPVKEGEVVVENNRTEVDIDTNNFKVEEKNIPAEKISNNAKIRMRVDHKCTIAMQRYDLKAGQVYTVPKNVRDILNRAGLLSPL